MLSLHSSAAKPRQTPKDLIKAGRLRLATALTNAGDNASAPAPCPENLLSGGFHELLAAAPGDESSALAFALSMAKKASLPLNQSLCVCLLASEAQERGALYGHGLAALGIDPGSVLMVTASKEKHLLWTLEEAVVSGAFSAVIGALGRQEQLYAFSESRRLKLRTESSGTTLFLLRHWQSGGATAARGRWRVATLPSQPEGEQADKRLPGPSRLELRLERMASFRPQTWEMAFDAARGFHMAPLLENGPARKARPRRRKAA